MEHNMGPRKLSVLMTVYTQPYGENGNRFLKEAIESVLRQSMGDFEFIIIDDGSTKESVEVIREYMKKDKRIKLYQKPNSGLTDSLNFGIKFCTAKFIARQDADDISLPLRFEKQYKLITSSEKIAVAGSYYQKINSNGEVIAKHCVQPKNLPIDQLAGSTAGANCILRKDVILKLGGWKYRYAQDNYMWIKIRQAGYEIVNVEEILYSYRVHPGQISARVRNKQLEDMWDAIKKAKEGRL